MRDWLVQLLTELHSYRRSHPGVLPDWPVTVDILILSMIPTILMYAIANMWLPRHVRLLRFMSLAGRFVAVRSRKPGMWYPGLRALGKNQGVQILRWGILLGLYVAVPAVWFVCLLRFIGTRFGRRLIKGSPDLVYVQNYLGWIAIILAFCCLLMLGSRGAVPRLGGPFRRLPVWLASLAIVLAGLFLAQRASGDDGWLGPVALLVGFLAPVGMHFNRRSRLLVPETFAPAWLTRPGAPGDPVPPGRQPKPRATKPSRREQPRFVFKPDFKRPIPPATKVAPTVNLQPTVKRAAAAFGTASATDVDLDWKALAPPLAPLQRDDPRKLGPFKLSGRIGEGGMGKVFYGLHPDGTAAAVKVPNLAKGDGMEIKARLVREIQVLSSIRVPRVARLRESGITDGLMWVAMEYIAGPTLEQAVENHGPIRDLQYLHWFARRLAETLTDLHREKIMHRDIKPANVILTADGPVLVDLGISIIEEETARLTSEGQTIGTPAYMPPEALRGQPWTPAGDVYAWGCVVIFAAIGTPAFSGRPTAVASRVVAGMWDQDIAQRLAALDPALFALVKLAMQKDPRLRPENGYKLLEALWQRLQ